MSFGNQDTRPSDDTVALGLLVTGTITALTLAIAFGLLALGFDLFWILFPLGFGVILPTALGLVEIRQKITADGTHGSTQFERSHNKLQQRYVRGELSDEEFEQQLERLMENEREGDELLIREKEASSIESV